MYNATVLNKKIEISTF